LLNDEYNSINNGLADITLWGHSRGELVY